MSNVGQSWTEREVLQALVERLSMYNQHDMLGGYLDPLAEEFNDALDHLGLDKLPKTGTEDED